MRRNRYVLSAVCMAFLSALPGIADTAGWRGDGTGHFADAKPPADWSKAADGKMRHILWQVKLPHYSWATPLIVGDRLFVRSEPYDLLCFDKNTGKLMWVRSHGPHEAVSEEDRTGPLWPEVLAAAGKLDEVNKTVYALADPPKALVVEKYQAQKQLNDLTAKINRRYRLAPELWRGKWSGYTGSTPCTDGRNIYFISCMGVVGCYDLDGNRQWMVNEPMTPAAMGEHGTGSSPVLAGDRLVYCLNGTVVALDKKTGGPIWRQEFDRGDASPSVVAFECGGETWLIARGRFIRAKDGSAAPFNDEHLRVMSMLATPVIAGNVAYFQDSAGRLLWCKWESKAPGELNVTRVHLLQFGLPDESKRWDNGANFWVPSPVISGGMAYCLSNQGRMVVVDLANAKITFDAKLDLAPNIYTTSMHGGYIVGACASPALAGGKLYVMDNTGTTLVMQPGPEPKVLAKNRIEQVVQPWDEKHWDSPHQEATLASPVFDGGRIYYRAELYLYCVGEK
ncbi:MAG: PQQ-binding-like beta-propeller repeat protein [Tepidisphaerales bacterium]